MEQISGYSATKSTTSNFDPNIQQIRNVLTPSSLSLISNERIKMMLMMVKNDVSQATLMSLAYVIQRLEILQITDKKNSKTYTQQLRFYEERLKAEQLTS